jgi:hypothetical protein
VIGGGQAGLTPSACNGFPGMNSAFLSDVGDEAADLADHIASRR